MRTLFVALVLGGFLTCAPVSQAVPTASISWDRCSPVVLNRDFAGPGVYELFISAVGLEGAYSCHDVEILVVPASGSLYPDAWTFWTETSGCQLPPEFSQRRPSPACPALLGPNPLAITAMFPISAWGSPPPPGYDPGIGIIRAAVCYDAITAVPSERYLLWRISFDHSLSVIGASDPSAGTCGHAEDPLCFSLEWVQVLTAGGDIVYSDFEHQTVTWQDGSSFGSSCMNPVRARDMTWGRVKSMYR